MHFLDLTLPTLAENLALDEALLEQAEAESPTAEVLRVWESPQTAVILGRASRREVEANVAACDADGVAVMRRSSGGCAVMIGPGCLMYAAVLSYELHPQLRILDQTHQFVMQRLQKALSVLTDEVAFDGTCDLTWRGRKFSGNSLRCKRTHLLYHGTILYDFPLGNIGRYLGKPPREPEYRAGRSHEEFVTNVAVDPQRLKQELPLAFDATGPLANWPRERTSQLVAGRYAVPEWHFTGKA